MIPHHDPCLSEQRSSGEQMYSTSRARTLDTDTGNIPQLGQLHELGRQKNYCRYLKIAQ